MAKTDRNRWNFCEMLNIYNFTMKNCTFCTGWNTCFQLILEPHIIIVTISSLCFLIKCLLEILHLPCLFLLWHIAIQWLAGHHALAASVTAKSCGCVQFTAFQSLDTKCDFTTEWGFTGSTKWRNYLKRSISSRLSDIEILNVFWNLLELVKCEWSKA